MHTSSDNRVTVHVCKTYGVVFSPADFSIVSVPDNDKDAQMLSKHLYNMPTTRHVCLLLNRYRRKERVRSMMNIRYFSDFWNFLDSVSILYEKPTSCSNNGLLPVSENGNIVYKGLDTPNISATEWFQDKKPNATNLWDISASELGEISDGIQHTYYQRFSWELCLLMYSLCKPVIHRNFIYTLKLTDQEMVSLSRFVIHMGLSVQLISRDYRRAEHLIKIHNEEAEIIKSGIPKK